MPFEVVILAAGKGTRMRSKLPKVLHCVAGKPMVSHVIDSAASLGAKAIHVVVGHGAETVKKHLSNQPSLRWAIQEQQLGTGHAVAQAMPNVDPESTVLIAYGDVPLVSSETMSKLVAAANDKVLSLLTVHMDNPSGYGRIVRNQSQQITSIIEQKDAQPEQLAITEVNTGILAVSAKRLNQWLPKLSSENAQGEYYLTDIISMAVKDGMTVIAEHPASVMEVQGANNRQQVSELERHYQHLKAQQLMVEGATLIDPARVDVRGELSIGEDIIIDVNCVFEGKVDIANDVKIGPNCIITNSSIGEGTVIKANTIIEDSIVAKHCDIGPFARLRPGSELSDRAKVGNFVETKKVKIGEGSKVNHLTYIGDCTIGQNANIGAGTITCNYDGANKFLTTIGDNAFIGSNSSLVAPVTIGPGATIGAGSTISNDVNKQQLAVARSKQRNIDNWQRPVKIKKD